MQTIDWVLVIASIVLVIGFAVYTRQFVKGVADFVAGSRCAGRYLICNARGEAGSGVANTMSKFQMFVSSGFVLSWWDSITVPILLIFAVSGFVIYRYRQTRAMTLGQFFEMRYSRRFRLFAGALGFLSGLLNYGIFPVVSSRFFVYFLALPEKVQLLGMNVPTHVLIMAAYLIAAACMMLVGGQITLMVTDCVEGILSHIVYLVIVVAIFCTISWTQMRTTITSMPQGHSLVNPFDNKKEFSVGFAFMTLATTIYGTMAAQKDNGFAAAARTPHESRMGHVLGHWRTFARNLMMVVLVIAAVTYTNHPEFHSAAASAVAADHAIADPTVREQMNIPVTLRYLLPAGVKGLFVTIMFLGLMAGDAAHMMAWGGIFIQDVVLPIRQRPLTPRQHVLVLRCAVAGVALFAFIFSILFPLTQKITFWWAATQAIFVAGAGAAIIGGLYWRKGTAAGAWAGMIAGCAFSAIGIIGAERIKHFPLNGTQTAFYAGGAAFLVYALVSWRTCRREFNMDRMLHRGIYAIEGDDTSPPVLLRQRFTLARFLNYTSDFTRRDKFVVAALFAWSMFWLAVTLLGTAWYVVHPWSTLAWAHYWFVAGIVLPLIISVITLLWFGIGGIIDLHNFFRELTRIKRDVTDDGTVTQVPEETSLATIPVSAARALVPSPGTPGEG
jgi:SSS family solute:Na+ symporter